MSGLSGTGKSTVAASLAHATGARLIASDMVRKQLAGVTGPSPAAWGEGLYAEVWTERTYEALLDAADESLHARHPVILDASFLDDRWRERAVALGADAGAPVYFVETVADAEVTESRIRARSERGGSPSDATVEIYRHQRANVLASDSGAPTGATWIQVDTDRDLTDGTELVLIALAQANALTPRIPMA